MKATFNGVEIELTTEQIQIINSVKEKHEKAADTGFQKVLKGFGFERVIYKDRPDLTCYQHPIHGWFAEVIDRGKCGERVFLVGEGLQEIAIFPGGWIYWGANELKEELSRATSNLNLK